MERQRDVSKDPAMCSSRREEEVFTKETEKEWEKEKSCGFQVGQEGKVGHNLEQ